MKTYFQPTKIFKSPAWTESVSPPVQHRGDVAQSFEFVAVEDSERSDVQAAWRQLLEAGRSPEKLYQLPEFFRYLMDTAQTGEAVGELHVLRRRNDAQIVGVIPGRKITQTLSFRLGPLTLFKRNIRVYQLLGSVPLLDTCNDALPAFVLKNLLQRNPDCRAVLMQGMPEELANTVAAEGLSSYVLNGWQSCHTMPLPETAEAYLQKLSSKKRYNLSRQVRLLSKEAGETRLVRIENPDQIAALTDGMRALVSPTELATLPSQAKLEALGRHGLLHSYLLQCGDQTVALVLGTRSHSTWHIHKIYYKEQYATFSVGTSIIHLALQDTIADLEFTCADFGYGTPNQEFRSTHALQRRGKLLLCQRRSMTNLLFTLHGIQDRMNEALISRAKKSIRRSKQR